MDIGHHRRFGAEAAKVAQAAQLAGFPSGVGDTNRGTHGKPVRSNSPPALMRIAAAISPLTLLQAVIAWIAPPRVTALYAVLLWGLSVSPTYAEEQVVGVADSDKPASALVSITGMNAPTAGSTPGPLLGSGPAPSTLALLREKPDGGGTAIFQSILRTYRTVISPVDGDRCDMIPTCSVYSHQALQEEGVLMGILLTADRLLHEADEQVRVTPVKDRGEVHYPDPLAHNIYWLPTWMGGPGEAAAQAK